MIVGSYNIHRWTGRDGLRDPPRTVDVLERLEADLVALQEVDAPFRGVDPADYLERNTPFRAVAGPTLTNDSGEYGNLVLSRHAPRSVQRIDLSVDGYEPRGAIDLEWRHGKKAYRVIASHLGLRRRERRIQIDRLLEACDEGPRKPAILLGDFNEWSPRSGGIERILRRYVQGPLRRTYPAWLPCFTLDRIFYDRQFRLAEVSVVRSGSARDASDHLPLRARFHCDAG
jgi:endonuclease/exonuclease/phosphatase family metal-dependent hydrolase